MDNVPNSFCPKLHSRHINPIVISLSALLLVPFIFSTRISSGSPESAAFALPPDLADNSYQEITGYTGQLLISSQTSQAYDPERNVVYFWGGHPPGGGFPQPDELFIWDVANGSWRVPRPANLTPSAYCIGAGPANNIYDEALHGYLKIGNLLSMKGQWYRIPKMTGVSQIYTPEDNDWHYMNSIGFPEPQPYTSINTGGARIYDRNSGTMLYCTPANVGLGGAIYDTWRNSIALMGSWNWLQPNAITAAQTFFNPNNNTYYLFDAAKTRSTKCYSPGDTYWLDKTPYTVPAEWNWNGSKWIQNTSYPPLARGCTAGTTMTAAAAWDDLNEKALFFIPIAVPRSGTAYEEWEPNSTYSDMDTSVIPTAAGGGWQGYRYTSLAKFSFESGNSSSSPVQGQLVIQGASRGTILKVEVNSGSFEAGNAVGNIYFKPNSWNAGPIEPGPADLYASDGNTIIKSSFLYIASFQTGGKTGSSEPLWPTGDVIGQLIQDGTVTWAVEAYIGEPRIEIWAYDPDLNLWERMGQIDDLVSHRSGDFSVSYIRKHNLFFLVDLSSLNPTGIGSRYYYYRYKRGEVIDYPKNPTIAVKPNSIILSWDTVPSASGYNIYRATGNPNNPWHLTYSKINANAISEDSYTDTSVTSGNNYFYHITAVVNDGESIYSPIIRSDTKAIWEGYVQVNSTNSQTIHWKAAPNAINYNIYRAPVEYSIYSPGASYDGDKDFLTAPMRDLVRSIDRVGTFSKVNDIPISGTSYNDSADLTGGAPGKYKIFAYRVTGINALGIESGPSAYWLTIPDQPRHLQWLENWSGNEGTIQLEWQSPPQSGVTYRVYYSINGDKASMIEATTNTISRTYYGLSGMPKALSAIYVSAVDALGQEGTPSPRASIQRPAVNLWDSFGYLNGFHVISGGPPVSPLNLEIKSIY